MRTKKRGVLMTALLCAHCSLAILVPLVGIILSVAGAYLGLPLTWVVPPIVISGAFLWLIWPHLRGSWARLNAAEPADGRAPPVDVEVP